VNRIERQREELADQVVEALGTELHYERTRSHDVTEQHSDLLALPLYCRARFVAYVAGRVRLGPVKRNVKAIHQRYVAGHKTRPAMQAEIRLRRILDLTGRTIHLLASE